MISPREARHAAPRQSERHDAAAKSGINSRPTCDFTKTYTDEQKARARKVLREFESWRERNPQAWQYVEYLAQELAGSGQRVGSQRLVEAIRARDFCDVNGAPTRTNNSYTALISRTLVKQHPWLADYIKRKRSIYDVLFGE